jgi:tetratricopeptide (TPR) repeat protein
MPDHVGWSATRLRTEAIAAERSGQPGQAIALLEEALRRAPDDWKSVGLLGALLARLGWRRAANEHYRRLAEHYERDQLHTKAIAVWKIVLSSEPDSTAAHVKLGELYALEGLRADARKHYGEALARCRAATRTRDAAGVEARIAELDEASSPGLEARGSDASGSRPEEAQGAGEAPAPDVDDVEFVKERLAEGRLFRRYGLADLARGQLGDLLARFPGNVEARRELRDLLQEAGRHEEAAEQQLALAALEGNGHGPMGDLEGLGDIVSSPEEDEWTTAGREIRSAVDGQVGRDDYETRYDLGIAYREMGLLDEAIAELQLASRGPSRLVECSALLAACFLDKGLPQLAVKWLERGLAAPGLDPQQALSLRYDLAGALEARGEAERAREIYVALYGEDARFRDVAEKVRRLRGATQDAKGRGPDAL